MLRERVQQGRGKHVAGDAACRVEVDVHGSRALSAAAIADGAGWVPRGWCAACFNLRTLRNHPQINHEGAKEGKAHEGRIPQAPGAIGGRSKKDIKTRSAFLRP
jgi:hypothetical protein